MRISRVVIRNFRNLKSLDITLDPGLTCVVGENNTGKTNLLHALRLVLDGNVGTSSRRLSADDITDGVDVTSPMQVLVAVQFVDFDHPTEEDKIKELAFAQAWATEKNLAQVCYRFRPRPEIRELIESGEKKDGSLTISDYDWEWVGGAAVDKDGNVKELASVTWADNFSSNVSWNSMSAFDVVMLPAIRDVEADLRRARTSPLQRLVEISNLSEASKIELVRLIEKANSDVSKHEDITNIAEAIEKSFCETVGPAHLMQVKLGMASPTFNSVLRSMSVLLTGQGLKNAEPARNGLGINNALYMSMLLMYLDREASKPNSAGRVLLVEEPEAHLHPQLQRVIFSRLLDKQCQVIATTHSTHITARAALNRYLILSRKANRVSYYRPGTDNALGDNEREDLERYLDATKSVLLFARRVLLVEGMSEVFLVPALVKKLMDIDLEELGVSVVPIHGVHFTPYMKLFGPGRIERRCSVLTDGDLKPSDSCDAEEEPAGTPEALSEHENRYVRVFSCMTTFERAAAKQANLAMFAAAARELGATRVADKLDGYHQSKDLSKPGQRKARDLVLGTARRLGKARFAQVSARFVNLSKKMPDYITKAVTWVIG